MLPRCGRSGPMDLSAVDASWGPQSANCLKEAAMGAGKVVMGSSSRNVYSSACTMSQHRDFLFQAVGLRFLPLRLLECSVPLH